jgi:exodeoxyribonuclease V alpha subunit
METQVLKGTLRKVRFSGERFFTVATLEDGNGRDATIVGTLVAVSPGDALRLEGEWVEDKRFGTQFKFTRYEVLVPESHEGVVAWLSSALPDVGFARALAMVQRFGAQGVFAAIEHEHHKLCQVPGITPERALSIHTAYKGRKAQQAVMVFLKRFGFTDGQCARVVAHFGEADVEPALRENPYVLMKVERMGWKTVDAMAQRMGVAKDHPERARAAVLHMLGEARAAGHCFVPAGRLVARGWDDLSVPEGVGRAGVERLLEAGEIVQEGEDRVYLPELRASEVRVAERLRELRVEVAA